VSDCDVLVVGAGPAGSTCAALCAQAGRKVILIDRSDFPREKVCGDCVNPAAAAVLDRLGVSGRLSASPHSRPREVEFVSRGGRAIRLPIPRGSGFAIRRSDLDDVLLRRAQELGASVRAACTLTGLRRGWVAETSLGPISARVLIAADGRNSTTLRLLGLLPRSIDRRVGVQAHLPRPAGFGDLISMRFYRHGHGGVVPVDASHVNVCLVGDPGDLPALRSEACEGLGSPDGANWRTITPLSRPDIPPCPEPGLFLVGDTSVVVEPFTGEGILHALRSGQCAADCLTRNWSDPARAAGDYRLAHPALYRDRLWINRLARTATTHPVWADLLLAISERWPLPLRLLSDRVLRDG